MKHKFLHFTTLLVLSVLCSLAKAEVATENKFNKLREMYSFYYLPFNIGFKVGNQKDDVFPVIRDAMGALTVTVNAEEMKKVETAWKGTREDWKKRSLFLSTPVDLGKKVRISPHLVSHKIGVNRTALDSLSFANKLIFQKTLQDKSPEIQTKVTQLFFLKSFLEDRDKNDFNFFIISPNWCASSKEYQAIFEAYFKKFTPAKLTIHSIVVEDTDESIFDSKLFKELFPNSQIYSHEMVPRFLALQQKEGASVVYEEGEALSALYENFFKQHQGFLNRLVSDIIPEKLKTENNTILSRSIAQLPKVAE
jgi:hypothetical protein